jgi:beta-glucanase (GH16 family)
VKRISFSHVLPVTFGLVVGALAGGAGSAYGAWQLTWSDEFDAASVDTAKWVFETGNNGGWGNSEREYYRSQNAYVSGGMLHIVARQESYGGFPYTSARMKTQGLFSKKYGRFEFRAKLPPGLGFWPALWMMGTNISSAGWPACGEIDVMEYNGSWSNKVQGTIHYSDSGNNHQQQTTLFTFPTSGDSITNFHVFALEWSTNSIKWIVDGATIRAWTSWSSSTGPYPAPFNQPFFILMNLAVGGSYLGYPSDAQINAGTTFPGEMQVDYVRVYDYVLAAPDAPTGVTIGTGNASVFLNWDAAPGATGYMVKRSICSGGPYTIVASPATNGYTDLSVSSCASYYYVVSATNSVGESTDSSEKSAALSAFSLAVNSGGGAATQFAADANFSGGTQATPTTTLIDTSAVVDPAPQEVYQTERYGNFTYTFTGLGAGLTYKVRLHFAETYWTAVGQRRFNAFINGTQVLTNFDIIAVCGAANKASIQEFTAAANGGGQMVIQYTTVTDNAKSSGIEIILPPPNAPAGLANAGDSHVDLSWSPLVASTSYNVKRATASGGPYSPLASGLTVDTYTDAGVTNGTTYHYVVTATVAGCESINSPQITATPFCAPPPAPTVGNNGPIWEGMTLNLTASTVSGATYGWTGPNGFTSASQNPSLDNATTNIAGIYRVSITIGGCTSAPATTIVTVYPRPAVSIQPSSEGITINWPSGTLQSASDITGHWDDLTGASSPYHVTATEPQQFFRIKLP